MVAREKEVEVRFYLDRSREVLISHLQSIVGNPRLSAEEQLQHVNSLIEHHRALAQAIEESIARGLARGLQMVSEGQGPG